MRRSLYIVMLLVAFSAAAASLQAQTAFTSRQANLRAGPDRTYPLVALLPTDTEVSVAGCVQGWSWCDVIAGPDRGWVYAGNLVYPYQDRRVTILSSGGWVGLPIVTFSPGIYWDTYYRGRPWYARRSYWVARPVPAFRPRSVRPPGGRPPVIREPGRGHPARESQSNAPHGGRPGVHGAQPQPAHPSAARPQSERAKPQRARPAQKEKEKPH